MQTTFNDVLDNIKYSYIEKSLIHGHGLFAAQNISEGVILGLLDGQLITWSLHKKYNLTLEWNAIDLETLLVRPYRTKYSYINHQRIPNLCLHQNPLRVTTLSNIKKGEEMTLDYRKEPLPLEYLETVGKYYL